MRFKPGQQVVCIFEGPWICEICGGESLGPKKDEVVTVRSYDGAEFIALIEYPIPTHEGPNTYPEICFEPLVSDDVLEKELTEIFQPAEV